MRQDNRTRLPPWRRGTGRIFLLALAWLGPCFSANAAPVNTSGGAAPWRQSSGILFVCAPDRLARLKAGMTQYLAALGIDPALYRVRMRPTTLRYVLDTPSEDTSTLDFHRRPELGIAPHVVRLPAGNGRLREVETVSAKEIVLALMQHGRLTVFSGKACAVEALRDHVGIRQNIVAWAEVLEWGWPEGGPAKWNRKYWRAGTPRLGHPLYAAVMDIFLNQDKYEIGCYTATKLVIVQGILDYYYRVKRDAAKARSAETRLLADSDPLANVEPGRMWSFEPDFDHRELTRPGKILRIAYGTAAHNFVPGDWSYFLNTDPVTYQKTGYEGSNAIYLGRDRFDDYYNDHDHHFSFREKLDEVYQWRHQVFSRTRDADKIVPLSEAELDRLGRPPEAGGLLLTLRTMPYFFGFETLPR